MSGEFYTKNNGGSYVVKMQKGTVRQNGDPVFCILTKNQSRNAEEDANLIVALLNEYFEKKA